MVEVQALIMASATLYSPSYSTARCSGLRGAGGISQVQGALRNVLVVSGNGGHPLANEAHPLVGQDRHVLHRPTPQSTPHISPRDDRVDARDLLRCCRINTDNASVRIRTMEGLAPEGAGEGHIRRIVGMARGLGNTVHPGRWLSNDVIGSHGVSSPCGDRRQVRIPSGTW